ncbi:heavy-metal-associated domain-containing protein [Leucobacter sp. UCMA 4100]|uniref:heavy-metal-associated domain-containing protein n=1 Tax=Micrococcales TaxID=85006 RepID=UPI002A49911F|nr:heavy-metal-associated domain-containing protein [Leucobacter sp. UCMA 4100]
MNELEFRVNGMTCGHCERALSAELLEIGGVVWADVDATTGAVAVRYGGLVERSAIENAVSEAGFEPVSWENEGS